MVLDDRALYWACARVAINRGLLSGAEAALIARVGTRKEIFWRRHLIDLFEIVDLRMQKREREKET